MNCNRDWSKQAPAGAGVPAGGYVICILGAKDDPIKERLEFEYDIADGAYRGHYTKRKSTQGFALPRFWQGYGEKSAGFFRGMLNAFEASNQTFRAAAFNNQESEFLRKYLGVVLGKEEYEARDGSIKSCLRVQEYLSADDVKAGKFTVPELKKLAIDVAPSPSSLPPQRTSPAPGPDFDEIIGDDNLPF